MHAVVRRYRGASDLNDLLAQRSQDVEQLLRDVPGFVAYYAIRAAEWVRQNLTGAAMAAPEITEGEAFIQFSR
jgi:hypothetical protein